MSFTDNLKGKKALAMTLTSLLVIILITVLPSCSKKSGEDQEVISKRVKINLQEENTPPAQAEGSKTGVTEPKPAVKVETPAAQAKEDKTAAPPIKVDVPVKEEPRKQPEAKKPPLKASVEETQKETPKKVSKAEAPEEPNASKNAAVDNAKTAVKRWAVNVASFPGDMDAKNLAVHLKSAGYNAYITEFTKDTVKWYRVRVGFYQTRKEALQTGKKIEKKFRVQTPWVVKPTKNEATEHAG